MVDDRDEQLEEILKWVPENSIDNLSKFSDQCRQFLKCALDKDPQMRYSAK